MTYQNPIIPGFAPDPSICRVGDDFYLINSTFEYFPGVPIFHSHDLVNWQQIGHCLTRPSQLPLEGVGASGGIYAPTIRHHAGRFYMVTTNVSKGGNFIVHTDDPAGEWSEPAWVSAGGIDPSLFFEEDGTCYYTAQSNGGILQALIDPLTGNLLSEPRVIWHGTGGQYPEGPHLFKKDGAYYLTIAEGGTEYMHMQTIARSASPWGPFESCPRNPVLSHRSINSPIHATGHSDFVEDAQGRWWVVFLAIRPIGYPPVYHLGRETFLAPVIWDEEGWPVVGNNGTVALEMDADLPTAHPWPAPPIREDFTSPSFGLDWLFLRNPDLSNYSLEGPGLQLKGSPVGLGSTDSPTWIGRRHRHFACRFEALMDVSLPKPGDEAGLAVRMTDKNHYEFALRHENTGRIELLVRRSMGTVCTVTARILAPSGPIRLRIETEREWYRFYLVLDDDHAVLLDQAETRYLGVEVAGGFTGVILAAYCQSPTQKATATIHWIDYEPA